MDIHIDTSEAHAWAARLERHAGSTETLAKRIVAKVALDTAATAQRLAPVDTGHLRSTISTSVRGLTAQIGPTAEYGSYVELGTSRMNAQPFLGPAADVQFAAGEKAFARIPDTL